MSDGQGEKMGKDLGRGQGLPISDRGLSLQT